MTIALSILVLGLIVMGAVAQRIAGLGFALLVSPFLVLILGPHEGVLLVNICGVVSSTLIVPRVWKDIDWQMFRWLAIPAVFGSVAGSFAAVGLPSAPLAVTVGAVVLAGLTASLLLQRSSVVVTGNRSKAVAGLAAGLTNSMAGVGGPAVSAYALLSRWPQRPFAATLQPFFAVIGSVTVIVKLLIDPGQVPPLETWMWVLIPISIILGIFAGERLSRYIHDRHARFAVIVIAFLGAATALITGIADLLA
ncbi:TSUP family transporter [Arthrobacter tumbae]|uniref:sulfite exporter TauE/SafE family protein n=1 Tax=Arthrobacter tumbae TaxID=163874 RepID=UPI00195DF03E|nr:sulfite exporter TauE/SafE family protein [Arthrobacter tumbae]MBM7782392.1 putative membrane protein YfcA [Arthrobacter tumbae]